MVDTERIVTAVIVIGIAALVLGVFMPTGLDALADDEFVTITQDNQTTQQVKPGLDTTLDDVNTSSSPSEATYTLDLDGTTETNTIAVGSTVTYTIDGDTIDVGLESVTSGTPDTATANYTYDTTVGYSSGASALWGLLDMIMVLGGFLLMIGFALKALDRV